MAQAATVPGQERTTRWVAIGAVVFAALAAVLLFVALQSRDDGGGGSSAATVDVVVAARSLDANTKLTADMLDVKPIASDLLLDGAYASTDLVVGLPLRYPLQAGEQVTSAKIGLTQIKDENDLALVLPAGKRAVAIEVSEMTSVGGLLLPGNFVDLIVVVDGGQEGLIDNRALTMLQNVEVLSVAQEAQEPIPGTGTDTSTADGQTATEGVTGQRPDDVERQPGARTVTVAVTPAEAQLLALLQAQDSGNESIEIMLALRPTGDQNTDGVPPFFPPAELLP